MGGEGLPAMPNWLRPTWYPGTVDQRRTHPCWSGLVPDSSTAAASSVGGLRWALPWILRGTPSSSPPSFRSFPGSALCVALALVSASDSPILGVVVGTGGWKTALRRRDPFADCPRTGCRLPSSDLSLADGVNRRCCSRQWLPPLRRDSPDVRALRPW